MKGEMEVGLRADIHVVPGLAGTDESQPSQWAPYDGAIDDFLATPGVAGTPIEAEFNDALLSSAEATAEGVPGWEALRRLLTREHHTVTGTDRQRIEVGTYWLTIPDVPDAEVELSVSDEKSTDTSASLTIAGIGGGPQFTVDLKEGLSHKTKHCEKVLVSTMATFEEITVIRKGKKTGTYPRLVAIDRKRLDWSFDLAIPPSAGSLGAVVLERSYKKSVADDSTTVELSISRGTTWNISAGITLPNFGGIAANISTKVTYTKAIDLQYQLPGRYRYEATMYEAIPAYIWSVQS